MSDQIQPTPGPGTESPTEPVPVPVAAPSPAPLAAAAAPSAMPQASAAPGAAGKSHPILGLAAQIVGVIGIVLFIGLAVGVVVGRGWAVDTVDQVTANVEGKIDKVVPLLDTASSKVSEVQGRIGAVADAANGLATQANASPALGAGLAGPIANLADRYNGLRTTYADVREKITSAIDSLTTVSRFIPGFTVPQGPIDALNALDAKVSEVDAAITGLADSLNGNGPIAQIATAVADKASKAEASLAAVSAKITDVQTQVTDAQAEIKSISETARSAITLGSVGVVLLCLWFALLHFVLFRTGRELRKGSAGS
jgi:hypothetical protein